MYASKYSNVSLVFYVLLIENEKVEKSKMKSYRKKSVNTRILKR